MDLIVGQAVALDIGINHIPMLLVVAQGIEHLSKRDVGKANHNLFGARPNFHNSAMARTGVRVPVIIGTPWRISSVRTMWGCCVAVVIRASLQNLTL